MAEVAEETKKVLEKFGFSKKTVLLSLAKTYVRILSEDILMTMYADIKSMI